MSLPSIFKSNKFWSSLSIMLMVLVFIITLISNLNLESSQGLWIDEEITFYPIQKIIKPYDLSEFWWLISDGGDYRYGRSLWNMMAAVSYFPARIFGPVGQIVAGRQLQVFLLLASFWLLSRTFIQSGFLRFLLILTLCSVPYSSYYMSMPKPEPELLFFGSLFLYFYMKNRGALGGGFWILLGLSIGSKISFFPPALVFICLSLYLEYSQNSIRQVFTKGGFTFIFVAIGFCLAIPVFFEIIIPLSYPALVLVFIFKIFPKKIAIANITLLLVITGTLFYMGLIPSLKSTLVLEALLPIKLWYLSTLGSVNEGGIGPNYSLINWLAFIPRQWLKTPFTLGFFYMSVLGYCVLMCGYRAYKLALNKEIRVDALLNASLLFISIAMLASPMTAVKNRLWGMYLYPGFVFFLTYLLGSLDSYLKQSRNEPLLAIKNNIGQIGGVVTSICLLIYATIAAPAQLFSNLSIWGYMPSLGEICKSDRFNCLWNKNIYPMMLIVVLLFTLAITLLFWMPAWISDFYYMAHSTEKFYAKPWLIGM